MLITIITFGNIGNIY